MSGSFHERIAASDAEARRWIEAARDARVCAALESVYASIGEAIAERRPLCEASGRCCRFDAYEHRLYVTGLEAAYTLARLSPSGEGGARGGVALTINGVNTGCLEAGAADEAARPSVEDVEASVVRGDCPLLVGGLCGAHGVKPAACRTFFCDATASDWVIDATERAARAIRGVHDDHGVSYVYGEWRGLLRRIVPLMG